MLVSGERRVMTLSPATTATFYIGCVALAEVVGVVWSISAGVICDAVLVAVLLGHFALRTAQPSPSLSPSQPGLGRRFRAPVRDRSMGQTITDPFTRLLPVLALLPLVRIFSVTLPVQRLAEVY